MQLPYCILYYYQYYYYIIRYASGSHAYNFLITLLGGWTLSGMEHTEEGLGKKL